ncbi:MAG: MBL fold metallo-hydrolase [Bacilli bacterium]
MRFTVLGFWGGFPEKNEATTGFLIEKDNFKLLLDCGSGVLSQLQNHCSPLELDAVLLTHYHHDHIADIGPLQYARLILKQGATNVPSLPIYGHDEDALHFEALNHKEDTHAVAYDPNQLLQIGPFTLSFLKTVHPVTCYAVSITDGKNKVTFTADSSYRSEFIDFAKDSDLFVCECNLYAHQSGESNGHMNSTEAGTIAQAANVSELLLTHFPHVGNIEQLRTEAAEHYRGPIHLAHTHYVWTGK